MTLPRPYADETPSSRRRDESPESQAQALARVGEVLASKYRLDGVVGSGGMGHVFRATNTAIGRTVAIKLLRPDLAVYPEVVERFLREARTANRVNHPNVVDVTDIGQDDKGTPFIVQEFLEGETLLDFATRQGGKLTLTQLAEIIGPVLSAVAEAHAVGVVHRDLKPENVFLHGRRGRRIPKVLDFGISKARGSESELTKVGVVMGTPAYMPPELVASFRDADTRADVWALGVIVFEMLAGRLPFEGATVGEVLLAVATKDAHRLSDWADVPEALADVVARCLKRDPAERYADADALAVALASAIEEREPDAAKQWSLRPPVEAAPTMGEAPAPLPGGVTLKVDSRVAAKRGATLPFVSPASKGTPSAQPAKAEAPAPAAAEIPFAATLQSESMPASSRETPPKSKPDETGPSSGKAPTSLAKPPAPEKQTGKRKKVRVATTDVFFVVGAVLLVLVVALIVASTGR